MDYTQNLHLPQWEADDRIMMVDFNDAFQTLDAMPRIVTGSYIGDGAESRTILLGVRPKLVIVADKYGNTGWNNRELSFRGGIALDGNNAYGLDAGGEEHDLLAIADTGFQVFCKDITVSTSRFKIESNKSNLLYFYVAFI